MNPEPKQVFVYQAQSGRVPYDEWLDGLKDKKAKQIILARIDRLSLGNAGDRKFIAEGLFELRIHYGPGFRVYYGLWGAAIVLLLCGGEKRTQDRDILSAQKFWADYRERNQ